MEVFLEILNATKIKYEWDYSNDLKTQYIIIDGENTPNYSLNILAKMEFKNLKEIIKKDIVLSNGLDGIVEYIILKHIDERLKEDYD